MMGGEAAKGGAMTNPNRGGRLSFAPGFLYATDEESREIRFTRAERALLTALAERPGEVVPRTKLLDVMSGVDADTSDRSVDFVINRLRRKLGDSAREPRYIATQYGEGYWWVPQGKAPRRATAGAFVVVGPIGGLPAHGGAGKRGWLFAEALRRALDKATASERRVVLDEDCPAPRVFSGARPEYAVELDFLALGERLDCALTLKHFPTGHVLHVARQSLTEETGVTADAESGAAALLEIIWKSMAHRPDTPASPRDEPLPLRMHRAAELVAREMPWAKAEERLRAAIEKSPDDHEAQLMLATAIHSKYLSGGPAMFVNPDSLPADEAEMERLVSASTPHIQDNPVLVLAAAKLLYFVGRGHERLALELAEKAFASSTAFAASFAVLGQIWLYEGRLEDATRLFEEGTRLCETGSYFHLYLLILRIQAALAGGRTDTLQSAMTELFSANHGAGLFAAIFAAAALPGGVTPEIRLYADALPPEMAAAHISFSHYLFGRLFKHRQHRINYMMPAISLLASSRGHGFLPDEVRDCVSPSGDGKGTEK